MSHLEKGQTTTSDGVPSLTAAQRPGRIAPRRLGNSGPLGLWSFASTTFILSWYNTGVRGIVDPNVVVGMALGVGGLAQLLAGMWAFAAGNTFGGTAYSSYGCFWLSFAAIYIPGSGILSAYESAPTELNSALGIYLLTWFIVTFLFLIAASRTNLGLIALLFFLTITFLLLAISKFQDSVAVNKAGGAFGVVTALIAYYVGLSEMLVRDESWITLPLGNIAKRTD